MSNINNQKQEENNNNNNNNKDNIPEDWRKYKTQNIHPRRDLGIDGPLQVKHSEADKQEQETVYRELAKYYCVCNHHKDKHYGGEYSCFSTGTRMNKEGYIETYECQCSFFTSQQDHMTDVSRDSLQ